MSTFLAHLEIFSLASGGSSMKSLPFSSSDGEITNANVFLTLTGAEVVEVAMVSSLESFFGKEGFFE